MKKSAPRRTSRSAKVAVSIPDDEHRRADLLARRLGLSRSALYAAALREYVERHDPRAITEAVNRDIAAHGQPADEAWLAAGLEGLRSVEW